MNISALAKQYLLALVVPAGRLPRTSFIAMVFGLTGAFALLRCNLLAIEKGQVWGWQLGLALWLTWAEFCVISRRMHDVGRDSSPAVVLLLVCVVSFLACLDPSLLGDHEQTQARWATVAWGTWWLASLAFAGVVWDLYRSDGETGANRFGAEFGADGIAHEQRLRVAGALGDAIGRETTASRKLSVAAPAAGRISRAARGAEPGDMIIPQERGLTGRRKPQPFGGR